MRPAPDAPDASRPTPGPTCTAPRDTSAAMCPCVTGLLHMCDSIAGASTHGTPPSLPLIGVASSVAVSRLSASPRASFASVFALSGATTTKSAALAIFTCGMGSPPCPPPCPPPCGVHISTRAARPLRAAKVSGPTNRAAASVRTTSTSAPACTNLLHRSAALYAAMPPVTPRITFLPAKSASVIPKLPSFDEGHQAAAPALYDNAGQTGRGRQLRPSLI